MTGSSSSGQNGGKPPGRVSEVKPRAAPQPTQLPPRANEGIGKPPALGSNAQTMVPGSDVRANATGSANTWDPAAPAVPQATIPCPKCGAAVREVARFCQHCHMTMRFECPACGNKQRTGVQCEKCGINFVKYIGAVVAAKKPEEDTIEQRLERRSALLKNILAIPLTGGLTLFKQLFQASNRKS
jgi:zinc-ribbon domain